jgi:C4-dicarboxylate-specific signal transduction histidine kinase
VEPQADHIKIRFRDTGPGVADPAKLFHPFQAEADTTGLGLYVSRAIVRSFGGELYHEPAAKGCCFVVQLSRASVARFVRHGKQPG